MAQSTTRLFYFLLVTWLSTSLSISSTEGFGGTNNDELSSKIDADLFLEDDSGSGDGRPPGFSDIDNDGSGCSLDDEDSNCKEKHDKTSRTGQEKTKIDDKVDSIFNSNDTPNSNTINPIFDTKHESTASFFSQPGILAAIICGAIVGLLCAILLVMFIVYRMRKKDEGSYVLEDSKRTSTSYGKTKEFYA